MRSGVKIFSIIIICFTLCDSLVFAQKPLQGVYLSGNDFSNNQISFTPIHGKKYKLRLHDTFYEPTVKIIIGDSTVTLNKDAVFGYRDRQNTIYRFYEKNEYQVLNPNETILLYSRSLFGGLKNSQTIVQYYFSAGANTEVKPLTKWELKNAFPNDPAFHELLDMYFSRDKDLLNYDNFYKIYKLNRVFQFAQQIILKNK